MPEFPTNIKSSCPAMKNLKAKDDLFCQIKLTDKNPIHHFVHKHPII